MSSFKLKILQKLFVSRGLPAPLQHSPDLLAGLRGKRREGEGKEDQERMRRGKRRRERWE